MKATGGAEKDVFRHAPEGRGTSAASAASANCTAASTMSPDVASGTKLPGPIDRRPTDGTTDGTVFSSRSTFFDVFGDPTFVPYLYPNLILAIP